MNEPYETKEFEQNGHKYRIEWFYDHDSYVPWMEHDGHGIVTEWTRRKKKPCERILTQVRWSFRYYDMQASIEKAKLEGWGVFNFTGTKKQIIAEAVERDFNYLRSWCNGEWHWCGVTVTELREDSDGFIYSGYSASLWGIESDTNFDSIIQDLIGEIESDRARSKRNDI